MTKLFQNFHLTRQHFVSALGLVVCLCLGTTIRAQMPPSQEIFRALRDEQKRSMSELTLGDLAKPYYIEYTLTVRPHHQVSATLGSLLESSQKPQASLSVMIRTGKPEFDNTNFFDVSLSFFGSSDDEESYKSRRMPAEFDYNSLRREIWLATDACYKQAVELLAKKESAVKNRLRTDTTPDFISLAGFTAIDTLPVPSFDLTKWEEVVSELSSKFREEKNVFASRASVEFLPEETFYVNSEGREFRKTSLYCGLEIVATAQCDDGMPVAQTYTAYARSPQSLPSRDSLLRATNTLVKTVVATKQAKTFEAYSGPVLFEDQAASEVVAQFFAPNLCAQRQPISEGGFGGSEEHTAFQNKIGGRVLPEWMSVVSTPSRATYLGSELIGYTTMDDEGTKAQDISLVEKGYLKTLLSSRVPTKRIKQSNGHQRGGASMLSNLELISLDKKRQLSNEDLRKRLLKICKDRDLPYALVITSLLNQNLLYTTLYQLTSGDLPIAQGEAKSTILEAYKLFSDGRTEQIRGAELAGMNVQIFKDIIAVGKKSRMYNYLAPAVSSPFVTGGKQYVGSSIITGDLLFEDCEVRPHEGDYPKPPILSAP